MTTSDLERRLTAALEQHAEDAMNRTNTNEKLEALSIDVEHSQRRRRIGLAVGAAAAVAAVTIAAIAFTNANDKPDSAQPVDETDAVGLATDYLDAYTSFDRAEAASYLAAGARDDAGVGDWNRWLEATQYKMVNRSCEELRTSAQGTIVKCSFAYHCLGSDAIDRGPFGNASWTFTIRDDQIVDAQETNPFETNGFSDAMWKPFAYWVSQEYPDDAAKMYEDWPSTSSQVTTDRSLELWEEHTKDYITAVQRGDPI